MNNVVLLAGARPNFIKIAPLCEVFRSRGIAFTLVHTGQHYDASMSDVFFRELEIPEPDINLGIGPGDRHAQTKKILDALVPWLRDRRPDGIVVVGDVTSTAAGALAGTAAGVPVIHVEAGLRSFNWRMPEELNRMIADHHAHLLFATEPVAMTNLKREWIPAERIHLVGNVMIDALRKAEAVADHSEILARLGLSSRGYGIVTLHRPENVDEPEIFRELLVALGDVAAELPLVFPVHHRTRQALQSQKLTPPPGITLLDPVGYFDMLDLTKNAKLALTDSGGLQEETTAFGVPCLTLRDQTERPITVEVGTSEIMGHSREKILDAFGRVMDGRWKSGNIPDLWDGKAAGRIADILLTTNVKT